VNDKNDTNGSSRPNNVVSTEAVTAAQLPFTPPGRALDLEYSNRQAAPLAHEQPGVRARCEVCGNGTPLAFDISLRAWEMLVSLAAEATSVSRRELLQQGGKRPTGPVYSARALLVQLLFRVATPAPAINWLRHLGWAPRRIETLCKLELAPEHTEILKSMNLSMLVGASEADDGQGG
jgi:hypothetical protein